MSDFQGFTWLLARTSVSLKLPADLKIKISSFHKYIRQSREENEFDERFIINMDENHCSLILFPASVLTKKVLRLCVFASLTAKSAI